MLSGGRLCPVPAVFPGEAHEGAANGHDQVDAATHSLHPVPAVTSTRHLYF